MTGLAFAPHKLPAMSQSLATHRTHSDNGRDVASTELSPVMASSSTENVVNSSQSVGEPSPIDVHANNTSAASAANGETLEQLSQSHLAGHQQENANRDSGNQSTVEGRNDGLVPDMERSHANSPLVNGISTPGRIASKSKDSTLDSAHDTSGLGDNGLVLDSNLDQSVGSDTDTSRADSVEHMRDAQNRDNKSASTKKLTSFKPVSVTKNFLAKTAIVPAAAKVGEKGPTAAPAQVMAKPRLVAKSGSGLRDIPRARSAADGSTEGATVWNKNRPAPPQPPKQFTDEELKQRYGIHLATRLQADEVGEKSKWADIDDEDDDWVPETVDWMDGTKSAIVSGENQPSAQEPIVTALQKEDQPRPPQAKPILTALKRPSASGPPKTILRPGAAQLAKQEGGPPKGAADHKPTLVTKSPAPNPVKSPWASLPPVEKASPVFQPPPATQHQPSSFGHRDMHGFDAMPPPSAAAREMEADTFDRSWKDGERGGRELFNSQSGRYEPAPERRRGSMRQDPGHRQPAVLQRPSQQDVNEPAGPSAAFQTRSSGQLDGSPWSRRRGSSVSITNSIPLERRHSITRAPDVSSPQLENRTGIVVGHDIGPRAPSFSAQKPPQPQQHAVGDTANVVEEVIINPEEERVRQKKIMQEKRELAIKRRKEEEEREEAARKERIRAKMESLGMAPLESKEPPSTPAQAEKGDPQISKLTPDAALSTEAPTKPAEVPSTENIPIEQQTPAQLIQPSQAQAQPLKTGRSDPGPQPVSQAQQGLTPLPPPVESPQLAVQSHISPLTPARSPYQPKATLHNMTPSSYSSPGEQKPQPAWKSPGLGPDSFAIWGNSNLNSHAAPSASVWGPPTASRRIGNGAFESNYPSFPRLNQQPNGVLSSSGSFSRQPNMSRVSPQTFSHQEPSSMMGQQIRPEQQLGPIRAVDSRSGDRLSNAQPNGIPPMPAQSRPYQPGPIAPPQRTVSRDQQQPPANRGASAWGQFAAQAEAAYADNLINARTMDSQPASTQPSGPNQQRWKETFKQTKLSEDWLGGPREITNMERTLHEGQSPASLPPVVSPAPPVSQTKATNAQPPVSELVPENTVKLPEGPSSSVRLPPVSAMSGQRHAGAPMQSVATPQQSRFFPIALYGGSPPPEESDHPVNYGDSAKPLVNLPAPKPQVRLPPSVSAVAMQPSPVIMPQRMPSFRAGAQPLVQSSDWQARFNGLFGRVQSTTATPPSPPRTPPKMQAPAAAVLASSIDDFTVHPELDETTVSLPRSILLPATTVEEEATTKATVDEIFDGELSFGSIPKVFLPRWAVYSEAFTGGRMFNHRPNSKFQRQIETQSKPIMPTFFDDGKRPGMVTILFPFSSQQAKDIPYRAKTKGGPHSHKASTKPSKTKHTNPESKNNTPSPTVSTSASPLPKGRGNREASAQKTHSPAGQSSPRPVPGSAHPSNINEGTADLSQKPKSKWVKPSKGKNYERKAQVGV